MVRLDFPLRTGELDIEKKMVSFIEPEECYRFLACSELNFNVSLLIPPAFFFFLQMTVLLTSIGPVHMGLMGAWIVNKKYVQLKQDVKIVSL